MTKKTCLHGGVRDAKVNSDDDSGIRKEVFEEVNKPSTSRGVYVWVGGVDGGDVMWSLLWWW